MLKTTVEIEGMSCPMCEAHINETIRKTLPDAKKIKASHKKGEASFLTEAEPDTEALRKAIDETGYRFLSAQSGEYQKRGWFFA